MILHSELFNRFCVFSIFSWSSTILWNLISILIKNWFLCFFFILCFKFFFFNFVKVNSFVFVSKLESDCSSNITNMFLDREQLIHISELKLVVLISKLASIAEPFQQHKFLVSSFLHNGMSNERNNSILIKVN